MNDICNGCCCLGDIIGCDCIGGLEECALLFWCNCIGVGEKAVAVERSRKDARVFIFEKGYLYISTIVDGADERLIL